ncbi:DUF2750 domain-containing protein [Teredinibacter purpureus]|uniref:DUF2750 domain-containing protein n=1 Tax=Teredinibacter purpureus TaxID=2731756 RepID=UPI001F2C9A40|nr:DUF2750 domain-containing protein [Teredinibacter purpureus]
MKDLSFKEIEKMDCESRYEIFLSMVAEERDIWVLVNEKKEFLKIHSEDHGFEYLPVWPHAEFTEFYSNSSTEKLSPKSVSVPEFFSRWVPGLERDGLKISVFPNAGTEVWIMEPSEVKSDLQDEFSNSEF